MKPIKLKGSLRKALPAAVGVALLPPLWAVISSNAGIKFGWVSLACAGMLLPFHKPLKVGLRQSLSFLMGCIWGLTATISLQWLPLPQSISLFIVLCIWGFFAVYLSEVAFHKVTTLSIWLGSWAIALGLFGECIPSQYGITFLKLFIAMLSGVWYIGLFNQKFQVWFDKCIPSSCNHDHQITKETGCVPSPSFDDEASDPRLENK